MRDSDFRQEGDNDSPCVKICVIHPQARICVGCYRSLDEIGGWLAMSRDERREVIAALPARAQLVQRRRGGRKARMAGDAAGARTAGDTTGARMAGNGTGAERGGE